MPRVSAEHLEQRRRQILEAAQLCFARKGFHESTMQDVVHETGLSTGAVYRYFGSKDQLIQAIALDVSDRLATVMDEVRKQRPVPPVDEVVGRLATTIEAISGPGGPAGIAVLAWAAALHDAEIGATTREVLGRTRDGWVEVARHMRDTEQLSADADPEAVGAALFGMLPGFLLQHLILGLDAATFQRGVRQLFTRHPGTAEGPVAR